MPFLPLALFLAFQPAPTDLLQQALANAKSAKTTKTRFTYYDLEHNQNRDKKGKLFSDRTTLYEDTYIADLPYKRVLELEHQLLTGSDLAREQARYDEAVAQRTGLDQAARARLLHEKLIDGKLDLDSILTPAYTVTELRTESLTQPSGTAILTHVFQATPVSPTATKSFQFWVCEPSGNQPATLLRLTFDVVADEPNMLRGSHGENDYVLIDGIALSNHTAIHFLYPNNGKPIMVDVEHTYTHYRRFAASAKIIEDATKPPNEP